MSSRQIAGRGIWARIEYAGEIGTDYVFYRSFSHQGPYRIAITMYGREELKALIVHSLSVRSEDPDEEFVLIDVKHRRASIKPGA